MWNGIIKISSRNVGLTPALRFYSLTIRECHHTIGSKSNNLQGDQQIIDNEAKLISEVLEVERLWAAAHRNLDLDMIRDILSDQYRQIQSDGTVIGKEELLSSYGSALRRWEIANSDDHEVRILGNVALLIGRWRGVGINDGENFDYSARFLAVYQLEGSAWKLISDVSVFLDR